MVRVDRLSTFLLLACLRLSASSDLRIEIEEVEKVPMGETGIVQVRLDSQGDTDTEEIEISLVIEENSTSVFTLLNSSLTFNQEDIRLYRTKSFLVQGVLLGIHHVQFVHKSEVLHTQEIAVVMNNSVLNSIFMLVMTVMIIVNTTNMGAQLDVHMIKEVFKKPVGPIVGFLAQFVFMPGISFLVGYLFTDDMLFRLGLFVLGCCPGGNGSNFWTLLLEGDINLSITMTFVSTVAALGMMPLWMYLMGPVLTDGSLVIPFGQLIISLLGLILPITLGMWIRWKWSKAANIMEKVIVPFTLSTVIFIFTAGVYINLFIFKLMTPLMVAAGFVVAFSGYVFGAGLAWLFRLPLPQITAVSVETSFQNGGIAFVLLKMSFPEPLGELASVAPVAQLMLTGLPLWVLFAILKIYKRCCKNKKTYSAVAPENTR